MPKEQDNSRESIGSRHLCKKCQWPERAHENNNLHHQFVRSDEKEHLFGSGTVNLIEKHTPSSSESSQQSTNYSKQELSERQTSIINTVNGLHGLDETI